MRSRGLRPLSLAVAAALGLAPGGAWAQGLVVAAEPAHAHVAAPVEVEVRGALLPIASRDPTVATTVIEGEALAQPGASAAEVLARVPGVQIARTGGAAELTTLGLRGATSAQTPVYLAGVPLSDELARATDLSTVPLFFVRRIEVYRGNAPIELDRLGMGGAILIEPDVPAESGARAGVGLGSFGERSTEIGASVSGRDAGAAFALRAEGYDGDYPYLDDGGTAFDAGDDRERPRRNADARTLDGWAVGRLRLGRRGAVHTALEAFSREQGVTGLGSIPATRARARTDRRLVALSSRIACGDDAASDACSLTVRAHGKTVDYQLVDPLRELPLGVTGQRNQSEAAGYSIAVVGRPSDAVEVEGGAGQGVDLLTVDPSGPAVTHARRGSSRFFGAGTFHPLPALTLRVAAAIGTDRTEATGPDVGYLSPVVRGGARVQAAPGLAFFANVGRYVRVPTLGETYGASATLLGNPELALESGPTADVGARYEGNVGRELAFGAEVTGFGRLANDLIAFRRSSLGIQRPYNVGSARVIGLEALARASLLRMFVLDAGLTATDPRDTTAGRAVESDLVPLLARLVTTLGAALESREGLPQIGLDRGRVGIAWLYRASRTADPAGLVVLPEQSLVDVEGVLDFRSGGLVLRARLSNLLDDRTTDLVGYPVPGRAGHLSVEAAWP